MSFAPPPLGPQKLAPVKTAGQLLLFEARRNELAAINNYTARWKTGSDLTPSAKPVEDSGEAWVELSFRGSQGMACSTLFFEQAPDAGPGKRYQGLELLIDCQRDDYPHIGVNVVFSDRFPIDARPGVGARQACLCCGTGLSTREARAAVGDAVARHAHARCRPRYE